jgi:parvulin-like peptidyl-prolyl isomerase
MFAPISLLLAIAVAPQEPATALATYRLAGREATVTRLDVALEMTFHLRRRDRGKQALELLVDTTLTRQLAAAKGAMPTEQEVRKFWDKLQEQLRAAGRRPEEFATVRNTSERQWLEDLALQLAQEQLVRRELALRPDEAVSADMLKLWLQEQRKRVRVVTDADELPLGTAARVGTEELPLAELGFLLLRTSEDEERDRFVRQVVYLTTIEALAKQESIEITPNDLDAAIQRRRDDAARDPRNQGITLDRLLEATGLTVAALRELRVFRAQILLDKLAQKRYPPAALLDDLRQNRQQALELVGPRRRLGIVFARALDTPNALVPHDFAAAKSRLDAVRSRLAKEDFAAVARVESDHGPSKAHGGDIGWHRRRSEAVPEPVLAAAFALDADAVSEPIRTEGGYYLVKVAAVEANPDDEQLAQRWREHRAIELSQQLLREADVRPVAAKAEATK